MPGLNLRKAFTLIETLVAMGLLAITVGSALVFLTSVSRGSNQAAVTSEVKQNGQAVLDSLERQMRGAFVALPMLADALPQGASNGIVLTLPNNRMLYVACFPSSALNNGWIGLADMSSGVIPGLSDYNSLTNNQNLIEGVDISACNFSVVPSLSGGASPAVVSAAFTINQAISAPSRVDFLANAQFQTTISLRNY